MTSFATYVRVKLHIFWWEFRQILNQKHNKPLAPIECLRGHHQWRYFADPFGRQCKVKNCGVVEMMPDRSPDGLSEYVDHYTAGLGARAEIEPPRLHQGMWTPDNSGLNRKDGLFRCWCGVIHPQCRRCKRLIPSESKRCPYCLVPFVVDTQCHADPQGECNWLQCPQLRDCEPITTGRACPLDQSEREIRFQFENKKTEGDVNKWEK